MGLGILFRLFCGSRSDAEAEECGQDKQEVWMAFVHDE
jgi:hypothetical protein